MPDISNLSGNSEIVFGLAISIFLLVTPGTGKAGLINISGDEADIKSTSKPGRLHLLKTQSVSVR